MEANMMLQNPAAALAKPLLPHMPKPLQVKTFKSLLEGSNVRVETDYCTNHASFKPCCCTS
jgi:hypothetical protein